jgi:Holliday junction resolvasome RuvABC DNA-binding subunit
MTDKLLEVTGVGPATARLLTEAGFADIESITDAEPKALAAIRGIGPVRAANIQTGAQRLLASVKPEYGGATSNEPSKAEQRAKKLRKRAKQLRRQASRLTKKADSTKSKKKRKQRLHEAAELEVAADKARRKAKKLLAK